MTEEHLIKQARKGNGEAQRQLYECYGGFAMATALRYLADRSLAGDAVQEAFIKVFTHLDRFDYRGNNSLRAWIGRIVAHESLSLMRRNSHYVPMEQFAEDLDENEPPPDVGHVPPDILQKFIRELPQGYRTVFCLYVFEEMTHREIGETLGISINTSASQYMRARQVLEKRIREYIKQQER